MNKDPHQFDGQFYNQGYKTLCGIDEVGRGALAGPVVAASVVAGPEIRIPGVKDSKKLTPRKREELFDKITCSVHSWSIGLISNRTIDRINILEATKLAMLSSVKALDIHPDFILIDGVKFKDFPHSCKTVIKGDDKSFVIASASIIAKVLRDRIMEILDNHYPQFGFSSNKGYGTKAHRQAITDFGPTPFHRTSFRPVYQLELNLGKENYG